MPRRLRQKMQGKMECLNLVEIKSLISKEKKLLLSQAKTLNVPNFLLLTKLKGIVPKIQMKPKLDDPISVK